VGVGPHVRTVGGDVDGDVADEVDAALGRRLAERAPLADEAELDERVVAHRLPEVLAGAGERLGRPSANVLGPVGPRRLVVALLERREQGVVVEPPRLAVPERLERGAVLVVGRRLERLERRPKRRLRVRDDFVEADFAVVERGAVVEGVGGQPPRLDEALVVDEQRVARERRRRLVR